MNGTTNLRAYLRDLREKFLPHNSQQRLSSRKRRLPALGHGLLGRLQLRLHRCISIKPRFQFLLNGGVQPLQLLGLPPLLKKARFAECGRRIAPASPTPQAPRCR